MSVAWVIGTGVARPGVVTLTHTLIHTKVLIEVIEHREGLKTVTEGAKVTGDGGH